MPEIIDHVSYLSKEIGPRPGGTEEEQQAALYIADYLQKEACLAAEIEDFNVRSETELPALICAGVLLVAVVLGLAVPAVGVVAFVLALIAAAIMVAEALGKPILSRVLGKGVSQNVVAKYEPAAGDAQAHHRKIVLVSHYDSGKVQAEMNGPLLGILPIIKLAAPAAAVVAALLLLIRATALGNAAGAPVIVVSVLAVIAMIVGIAPGIFALAHRFAAYNQGANCNASGVAVLMEAAARVGRPSADGGFAGEEPTIHGEEAARAEGLVSDGVALEYETPQAPVGSAEARLAQAKAAIAAISGKPVPGAAPVFDADESLAQMNEESAAQPGIKDAYAAPATNPAEAAAALQEQIAAEAKAAEEALAASRPAPAAQASPIEGYLDKEMGEAGFAAQDAQLQKDAQPMPESFDMVTEQDGSTVPAWFARAQEKAKRPKNDDKPVHRSRYADALDAAVSASSVHFQEANDAVVSETEQRLAAMRDTIMEVKAPGFEESATGATHAASPANAAFAVFEEERETIVSEPEQPAPEWSMPSWMTPGEPEDAPLNVKPISAEVTPLVDEGVSAEAPADQKIAAVANAPAASSQASVPVAATAQATTEEYATCAMMPIDVTGLADIAAAQAAAEAPAPFVAPIAAEAKRTEAAPVLEAVTAENLKPVAELKKQRAPLDDAAKGKNGNAAKLRAQIPSIESPSQRQSASAPSHQSSMTVSSLRSSLPSLSGSITLEKSATSAQTEADSAEVAAADATVAINQAGSFAPASVTGSFAPVDEELFENVDADDIYVDDADDSAYDGAITETGAFAGPGYVEMPKSRVRKFFDRFSRKKRRDDASTTPQEWLDVDDSFDARTVGADRGGWESFRDESAGYEGDGYSDDAYADDAQGGYDDYDDFYEEDDQFYEEELAQEPVNDGKHRGGRGHWMGGAFSRISMGNANVRSEEEIVTPDMEPEPAFNEEAREQIYHFHNPDITTEVWFVALGSELSGHNGMSAFLAEHADELRGAIIVDLEALGAGSLSLVESEGVLRRVSVSSRMKRYVKKAAQVTGAHVGSASIAWGEGSGAFAARQGFQAMHLAGMDGSKPAYFGQQDDTIDVVDEETLAKNAEFVVEMLKNM